MERLQNAVSPDFTKLDLGSGKPSGIPMEEVHAIVSNGPMLQEFARAFVNEAQRKAPLVFNVAPLSVDEINSYCHYLLNERIKSVHQNCPEWRKLKVLWIPCFIQYALSLVGKVVIRMKGITILPEIDEEPMIKKGKAAEAMTYEDALAISDKISAYEGYVQMVKDGMPRGIEGDVDLMTTALIAGFVRSIDVVDHISTTYITAFLNMKIKEEAMYKVLYRVQYDDIGYISSALLHEKVI